MHVVASDEGVACYGDTRVWLHQASRLREAEPSLHGVTSTVGSLQVALRRVRAEIMEPYEQAWPFSAQHHQSRLDDHYRADSRPVVPTAIFSLWIAAYKQCAWAAVGAFLSSQNARSGWCPVIAWRASCCGVQLTVSERPDPVPQVRTRTRQLRNLHETVDLLRQALHRLKLTAKLRAQLAAAKPAPAGTPNGAAATGGGVSAIDLAKAAKLLADVGAVEEEGDLSGLAVLDADGGLLASAGQLIRTQADVRTPCGRRMESNIRALTLNADVVVFLQDPARPPLASWHPQLLQAPTCSHSA